MYRNACGSERKGGGWAAVDLFTILPLVMYRVGRGGGFPPPLSFQYEVLFVASVFVPTHPVAANEGRQTNISRLICKRNLMMPYKVSL